MTIINSVSSLKEKQLFQLNQSLTILGNTVEIIEVYPPGHPKSWFGQYYYLVKDQSGEMDHWNQNVILTLLTL